ncbi:winged helix-turn-helix transcriptional regulator [Xanthobacter versatilis]|uniref:winged helix-turn-helix transcriptional regulator n=1 Tax=Xanthobacter autotrophicus (strain ATCC BAA-1158 / Py2) TaxID=78245 RepID=UPI00372A3C8E
MKRLRKTYGCPVELSLDFVGGKWKTVILAWLKEAPHRYNELRARLPDISDKVLTERLKDLEMLDLVTKAQAPGQPGVQLYLLTERGESLRPVLDALYAWGADMAHELKVSVGAPRPRQRRRYRQEEPEPA